MNRQERRKAEKSLSKVTQKIDRIYEEIPALECKGLCYESCGPIAMEDAEFTRIHTRIGYEPQLTSKSLDCPLLTEDKKCSVYDIRPGICRLWGNVESMECPHGCRPEKLLTREEGFDLLNKIRDAGR